MTEAIRAYWFCRDDMTSPHAPDERWEVGQTRELEGKIILCEWGFHGSLTPWDAFQHATGPVLCRIELSGTIAYRANKLAASRKTFVAAVNLDRELRLYAADCAERVLPIWEARYPDDMQPRRAIRAARDYAYGRIDAEELAERAMPADDAAKVDVAWLVAAVPAAAASASAAEAATAAKLAAARAARAAGAARMATRSSAPAVAARITTERAWQRTEFERRFGNLFEGVGA